MKQNVVRNTRKTRASQIERGSREKYAELRKTLIILGLSVEALGHAVKIPAGTIQWAFGRGTNANAAKYRQRVSAYLTTLVKDAGKEQVAA